MDARRSERLTIRVVSDVICPWCFIGKQRLEKALLHLDAHVSAEVRWWPFELNPDMPLEGIARQAYRSAKFGTWVRSLELDAQVAAVGASEGIEFAFEKIQRTPNTFAAHRLIWFAGKQGKQSAVVEELFRRYFTDGDDVGAAEVLAAIAERCGIPATTARDFLQSDDGAEEVARESESARRRGISGVPTFVVNDTHAVTGAQTSEALVSVFRRALGG